MNAVFQNALAGDDLVANLFADFATRYLSEAFEGEFFGGAGTAAGDDVAVDHHAVGQVLLADEVAFAARETSALAVLEDSGLILDAQTPAREVNGIKLCKVGVLQQNICLNTEPELTRYRQAVAD